ncbi:MAG: hypothetical protein HMLKMBBP_02141 [Planctomycetes bacterium]|nr:hypothetical protein [Planctomycetota bacterium]
MRRQQKGFTLIEIMVVIAIIAGLVGTVVIVIPQVQEKSRKTSCAQNLGQLGTTYVGIRQEKLGKMKYDGAALFLSWRKAKNPIREREEQVLICPGDQTITGDFGSQKAIDAYNNVDLASPPDDLCSFAVRDFTNHPTKVSSGTAEIIACDKQGADGETDHHIDGLNIVMDNGSAKFFSREELSISPNDKVKVGPDAANPMLKTVIYRAKAAAKKE